MNPSHPADPGNDTAGGSYSFTSRWRLEADRDRVWQVMDGLLDSGDPFTWWPGMHSTRSDDGDIHVVASSPVGYRLRFRLHDLVETPRDRVTLRSDGDLVGDATMVFAPVNDTSSTLDVSWCVSVGRLWMRRAEPVLRPLFVLAHDVVMRRGERALNDWMSPSSATGSPRRRRP